MLLPPVCSDSLSLHPLAATLGIGPASRDLLRGGAPHPHQLSQGRDPTPASQDRAPHLCGQRNPEPHPRRARPASYAHRGAETRATPPPRGGSVARPTPHLQSDVCFPHASPARLRQRPARTAGGTRAHTGRRLFHGPRVGGLRASQALGFRGLLAGSR